MISIRYFEGKKTRHEAGSAVILFGIFVVCLLDGASGEYETNGVEKFGGRSLDENGLCLGSGCAERVGGPSGAMWFGPRLGRRRRSDDKVETFDEDQINAIVDAFDGSSWILVPVQNGGDKRQANQFTPRLGRASGVELIQKYILMDDNGRLARLMNGHDDLGQRHTFSPTPRPGRRLPFTPSPRLGRRLRDLLQKL